MQALDNPSLPLVADPGEGTPPPPSLPSQGLDSALTLLDFGVLMKDSA